LCREVRPETVKNAGFTIIEVLIAIAIVAVSLTSIGALTGVTTRGVRSLEQHVALVETARTVVASLPSRTQLSLGEVTGELYGSRWRMGVSPFLGDGGARASDSPWIPATISIRVQSPSGAALNIETVRLQPRRQ
jgi:general secretion pathway protein I